MRDFLSTCDWLADAHGPDAERSYPAAENWSDHIKVSAMVWHREACIRGTRILGVGNALWMSLL